MVALLALQEVAVEIEATVIAMEIGVMMLVATRRSQLLSDQSSVDAALS